MGKKTGQKKVKHRKRPRKIAASSKDLLSELYIQKDSLLWILNNTEVISEHDECMERLKKVQKLIITTREVAKKSVRNGI